MRRSLYTCSCANRNNVVPFFLVSTYTAQYFLAHDRKMFYKKLWMHSLKLCVSSICYHTRFCWKILTTSVSHNSLDPDVWYHATTSKPPIKHTNTRRGKYAFTTTSTQLRWRPSSLNTPRLLGRIDAGMLLRHRMPSVDGRHRVFHFMITLVCVSKAYVDSITVPWRQVLLYS